MYCPKVESECIGSECYAFTQENFMKCEICSGKFQLGGSCSEIDHRRQPSFDYTINICKYFNIKIEDK
jgi:hypothetical protein